MVQDYTCSICGNMVISREWDSPISPRKKWHHLIRAVYTDRRECSSVTGVGFINEENMTIVAPEELEKVFWDPVPTNMTLFHRVGQNPLLIVHGACWGVLLHRVLYGSPPNADIASLIARIFDCVTRRMEAFGNSWCDRRSSFNPRHNREIPIEIVLQEPSKFEIMEDLSHCLPESPVESSATLISSTGPLLPQHGSVDMFAKLPTEIIHILLSWIPLGRIQRLRLASISIASRSHPGALPQFFWRSRFIPDFEMGFALPVRIDRHHDWRVLYFRTKRGLQGFSYSSGRLMKRKRIWDFLSEEHGIYYQELFQESLGAPLSSGETEPIRDLANPAADKNLPSIIPTLAAMEQEQEQEPLCPICGVRAHSIAPRYWTNARIPEWLQSIRAVYKKPDDSAGLTGVGYLNSQDELVAPEDREKHIVPEDRDRISSGVALYVGPSSTYETPSAEFGPQLPAFLVHDECWEVFLQRISYGRDVKEHLTDLIQIFYRVSYYKEAFDCQRHDFGDFHRFWSSDPKDSEEMMEASGLGYVEITPVEYDSMEDLLADLKIACRFMPDNWPAISDADSDISTAGGPISSTYRLPENGNTDPFAKLPPEVIYTLLSWTDSDCIRQLSLASRAIASRAQTDLYPPSFWYSRFMPDFEMGFALPRDTEGSQDWYSFYLMIKWVSYKRSHDNLRNRERIWSFFWDEKRLYQKVFKDRADVSTSA